MQLCGVTHGLGDEKKNMLPNFRKNTRIGEHTHMPISAGTCRHEDKKISFLMEAATALCAWTVWPEGRVKNRCVCSP